MEQSVTHIAQIIYEQKLVFIGRNIMASLFATSLLINIVDLLVKSTNIVYFTESFYSFT